MIITYGSKKLEKILTDERLIKKHYTGMHINIMKRITELESVKNLSLITHLPPPCRHKLSGKYEGYWGISISPNYRLLIKPIESQTGFRETDITEIIIMDIVDYH